MFSASPTGTITENGDTYIPASQRPDGTWRKARRVKEGYVPQEEVPLYESKGKQIVNRQNSKQPESVVLPSGQTAQRIIPGLFILDEDEKKPQKKKKKNKEEDLGQKLESIKISDEPKQSPKEETTDPAKKLRNLKKRLREVEALEEKLKSGLIEKPEPDQLAKVQRKNDLIMQIHELEKQVDQ